MPTPPPCCHSEPRANGDGYVHAVLHDGPVLEQQQVLPVQRRDTRSERLEVIDDMDLWQSASVREMVRVDLPVQVRQATPAASDRSGYRQPGALQIIALGCRASGKCLMDGFLQGHEAGTWETEVEDDLP